MFNKIFDKKIIFPNSLSKMGFYGKIKEIKIRFEKHNDLNYREEFSDFREYERKIYKDYYFNSLGNLIEVVNYLNFDLIDSKFYFSFNSRNELLNEKKYFKSNKEIIEFDYNYKYLPKSIVVLRKKNNKNDNSFSKKIILKKKKVLKKIIQNNFVHTVYKETKIYNSSKLIEVNNNNHIKKFTYDELDKIIKIEYYYNFSDKCVISKNYFYDKNNKLKSCKVFEEYQNETPRLLKEYTYINDHIGNWIKKTIKDNSDLSIIIVNRDIKYF